MQRPALPLVVTLAILLCVNFASAQDGCKQLFKAAFEKMKNIEPSNKGLALQYVVIVQTAGGEIYQDSIRFAVFNKRSSTKSGDMTVYQDEKTMVAIRPESQVILMTKPEDASLRKMKFQGVMQLQDSIFTNMQLKNCVTESSGLKKMTFQFPPKIRNKLGVRTVHYWINEAEVMVKKLQLVYEKGEEQKLASWTMEFISLNQEYAGRPFEGSALSKVFDSKSKLKPIYKSYSVIDKR